MHSVVRPLPDLAVRRGGWERGALEKGLLADKSIARVHLDVVSWAERVTVRDFKVHDIQTQELFVLFYFSPHSFD